MPTEADGERLLDLLEQCEELHRAGRESDVAALCAGFPELAGELLRRIMGLDHLDSLMSICEPGTLPTDSTGDAGASCPGSPVVPALVPAVVAFGGLRFHARGGQSEVYEGFDESLGRPVAIKLLGRHRSEFAEGHRRFDDEVEITSRLEHPGIAPVYCRGKTADGRPYYAMQFIRGETFHDAIDRFHAADGPERDPGSRGLALRQLLVRLQGACNTVAFAHSRGVLHRDLKPRNILLGEFGETIVVDWGLGKQLDPDPAWTTSEPGRNGHEGHTLPDEAMGSPGYLSPEQAAGDLERIGARSDVYSLGAILYILLTGRPAFDGPNLAALLRRTRRAPSRAAPAQPAGPARPGSRLPQGHGPRASGSVRVAEGPGRGDRPMDGR